MIIFLITFLIPINFYPFVHSLHSDSIARVPS